MSAQVLAEFYNTATLKMRDTMPPDQAEAWVDLLSQQHCVTINSGMVKSGIRASKQYHISYWDGAIIAAAEALGAPLLYTEDLNHGQAYGSVTAINPFLEAAPGFHEPPAGQFGGAG